MQPSVPLQFRAGFVAYIALSLGIILVLIIDPLIDKPVGLIKLRHFTRKQLSHGLNACSWDYEGSWRIGFARGSPDPMHLDVSPEPVITCANLANATAVSFVADPFLFIPDRSIAPLTAAILLANSTFGNGAKRGDDAGGGGDGLPWFAFYEMKNLARYIGELGVAVSYDDGATWLHLGTALAESFHLSFPLVLYDSTTEQYLMFPETSAARDGAVRVYGTSQETFPFGWQLLSSRQLDDPGWAATRRWFQFGAPAKYVDTAPVWFRSRWWIFTTRVGSPPARQPKYTLLLYTADELLGEWRAHPSNLAGAASLKANGGRVPYGIDADPRYARNGGRPFVLGDALYRWSQDCSRYYGEALVLLRADVANESSYVERVVTRYEPRRDGVSWNAERVHHADLQLLPDGTWGGFVDGDRYADGMAFFIEREQWFLELKALLLRLAMLQLFLVVVAVAMMYAGYWEAIERIGPSGGGVAVVAAISLPTQKIKQGMAALDPAVLERELEALRRQRYEASQRVQASRQPLSGTATQARNASGDAALVPSRPALGSGRFGPERGFSGPPPLRGGVADGPRAASTLREGPLSGRLGSGPSPRGLPGGAGPHDGPSRGSLRFHGGSGPSSGGGGRGFRDHEDAAAVAVAAPPPRRRAVLSVVVSDHAPQQQQQHEAAHADKTGQPDSRRENVPGRGDADRDRDYHHGHHRARDGDSDRDLSRGRRLGPALVGDDDRDLGRSRDRGWGWDEDRRRREYGNQDDGHEHGYGGAGGRGTKRPAPAAAADADGAGAGSAAAGAAAAAVVVEDPDSRKRARRLLGRTLLGTLQRFRQEDAAFQASDAAARRAELARKAEEKAAAEAERLRRQAAEERARKRQEELDALMDLNLATDIKVLELLYAKKLARRRALAAFLRADGVPASDGNGNGYGNGNGGAGKTFPQQYQPQAVYWLPVSHCPSTLALKERQEQELKDWEEAVLAELELEKDGLRLRSKARRQGIAERRQRAAEARTTGRAGAAAAAEGTTVEGREDEDVAEEDREALEAVELDAHHEDVEVEEEEVDEQEHEVEVEAAEEPSDGGGGTADAAAAAAAAAEEEEEEEAVRAGSGASAAKAKAEENGKEKERKVSKGRELAMGEVGGGETAKAAVVRDDSDSGAGDDEMA
ncbi:acetylglucosaminyltransferase [Volvox carteri f. nagariensis]|uniref:Acetylglucosaminyltransferase n=1 Tax=Volvox carteri f. nagariensis TaxID=3068 RepID=D8UC89_VOLCA|nr:acetylglucosaminyltransferase [Volvox carteri f. nagariensis]EFJ42658.1 acetylglucosaminyltransferase [Volvox carteri f. nagariensis]|eukprot:XP_002956309.1 acetylglucosaminyltransferase [Volvox carteri f. nagariensis]